MLALQCSKKQHFSGEGTDKNTAHNLPKHVTSSEKFFFFWEGNIAPTQTHGGTWKKRRGKEELKSISAMYISKHSGMDHTVLPANTPCLPFLRKRSPDGATSNWGKRHPRAAYYSSIDPEGMKGWVGLVGTPIHTLPLASNQAFWIRPCIPRILARFTSLLGHGCCSNAILWMLWPLTALVLTRFALLSSFNSFRNKEKMGQNSGSLTLAGRRDRFLTLGSTKGIL